MTARRGDRVDVWSHLLYVRQIRANRHRIPAHTERVVYEAPFDYPWLIHWVLSFAPESRLAFWERHATTVIAAATTSAVFLAGWHAAGLYLSPDRAIVAGWSAAALYVVAPMATNSWSGLHAIGDRPLGVLLVSATAYFATLGEASGEWVYVFAGGLAAALALLASKFAVQAILLVLPIFALLSRDAFVLLIVPAALLIASALSAGKCWSILAGNLRFSRFYAGTLQWSHLATTVRHRELTDLLRIWRSPGKWVRAGLGTPPVRAVLYNPAIAPVVYAWLTGTLEGHPPFGALVRVILASYLVCLLVATVRPLRFIGEADRYVYFAGLLPSVVIAGFVLARATSPLEYAIVGGAALVSLAMTATESVVKHRSVVTEHATDEERAALHAHLRGLGERIVTCIPANFSSEIAYHTGLRPLMWLMNIPRHGFPEFRDIFPTHYPFPTSDLRGLAERHGLQVVVVYRRYLQPAYQARNGFDIRYDFDGWQLDFESDAHAVYVLPG